MVKAQIWNIYQEVIAAVVVSERLLGVPDVNFTCDVVVLSVSMAAVPLTGCRRPVVCLLLFSVHGYGSSTVDWVPQTSGVFIVVFCAWLWQQYR